MTDESTCKTCGEKAEDCLCKSVRILMRLGQGDFNGNHVGYAYHTVIVRVPFTAELYNGISQNGKVNYEIIGGEWL
jgi:hypothetical protein